MATLADQIGNHPVLLPTWRSARCSGRTRPFPLTLRAFADGSLQYDAPNGVKVYLDIDPQTHLPSRLHLSEGFRTNAGDPIAGRTVARRWDLETTNVKHFPMFDGLAPAYSH